MSVPNLGKYSFAEKVFPVTGQYLPGVDAPSNSVTTEKQVRFGLQWGEEEVELVNSLEASYVSGESSCKQWAEGVLNQIHEIRIVKTGLPAKNIVQDR